MTKHELTVSDTDVEAIRNVIAYLATDERKHYEECLHNQDEAVAANHIWLSVSRLARMLENNNLSPTSEGMLAMIRRTERLLAQNF
jgi:hypothetical protein